jgi:hypothetical protein
MRSRSLFPRSFGRGRGSVGRIEPAWFAADTAGMAKTAKPSCWDLTACLGSRSCAAERLHGPQSSADVPASLLNRDIADTLEEAKAALASRYQQIKCTGNDGGRSSLCRQAWHDTP